MRHTHLSSWTAVAVVASIAGAAAQAGEPRASQPAPDVGRTVTLKGCLQSWDGSPTGIGRGDVSGGPMQFVLTNVEEAPGATAPTAAPQTPTGTSGTGAPSAPAPMAHDTYVVQPKDPQVQLRSFLDQQVEVTGMLEVIPPHDATASGTKPESPGSPSTTAPQPAAAAPSQPGTRPQTTPAPTRAPMQRVVVAALKTVAKTCP